MIDCLSSQKSVNFNRFVSTVLIKVRQIKAIYVGPHDNDLDNLQAI